MAKVFGIHDGIDWLPDMLREHTRKTAVEIDWVLEGLARFARFTAENYRGAVKRDQIKFALADVVGWADNEDDFMDQHTLTNVRRLARYIEMSWSAVAQTTGIVMTETSKGKEYHVNLTVLKRADTASSKDRKGAGA